MESRIGPPSILKNRAEKQITTISCCVCPPSRSTSCANFRELYDHITGLHVAVEYYACSLCPEALHSEDALYAHLMHHDDPPLYQKNVRYLGLVCAECGLYARISPDGTTEDWTAFIQLMDKHDADSLVPVVVHSMMPLKEEPQLKQEISFESVDDLIRSEQICPHCQETEFSRIDMKMHLLEGRCDRSRRLPQTRLALATRQMDCARELSVDNFFKTGSDKKRKREVKQRAEKVLLEEEKQEIEGYLRRNRIITSAKQKIMDDSGVTFGKRFMDKSDWRNEVRSIDFESPVTIPIFRQVSQTRVEYTPNGLHVCLHSCDFCRTLIAHGTCAYMHNCNNGSKLPLKRIFMTSADGTTTRIQCPLCETHTSCSVLGLQVHLSLEHNVDYTIHESMEKVAGSPRKEPLQLSRRRPSESEAGPSRENKENCLRLKLTMDPITRKFSSSSLASPVARKVTWVSSSDSVTSNNHGADSDDDDRLFIDESEQMETDNVADEAIQAILDENPVEKRQEADEPMDYEEQERVEPEQETKEEPNAEDGPSCSYQYGSGQAAEAKNEAGPSHVKMDADEKKEVVVQKLELEDYYFQPPRSSYLPKEDFFHLCRICLTVMPQDRQLFISHMWRHSREEKMLQSCKKCSLLVKHEDLPVHLKSKNKIKMLCTVCAKAFPDDIRYYCHLAEAHSADLVHFCIQ